MPEDRPREITLYMCNKYLYRPDKEEVVFCNAPSFCDLETKARRRCTAIKVILVSSLGAPES